MRKRSFQLALVLLALFIIISQTGCKTGGGPAGGLSTKNEVVWHELGDIERMNPYLSTDESSNDVQSTIWETLTAQNPRNPDAFIPALASIPQESADHMT